MLPNVVSQNGEPMPTDAEQSLANLLEQLARTVEQDGVVDVEAVIRSHPQHARQLRELFPTMMAMACWGRRSDSMESNGYSDAKDNQRGGTLGDFHIRREIGRGGMGVVYEAEQISLRRRVALKTLPFAAVLDKQNLQRFKNEALAAAALDHPNIVSVYSVGEERGVHYFAMQLIRGQTLADVIQQLRANQQLLTRSRQAGLAKEAETGHGSALSITSAADAETTQRMEQVCVTTLGDSQRDGTFFKSVARLGIQAADALQHAHNQGVVHRDIKPGNLMLDADGQLYVTDFGLARIETDVALTMTGDLLGTLRYMAPEQALGKRGVVDYRADIYALGASLYELLTLTPLFGDVDRGELLKRIATDEPRPLRKINRQIPVELETIVLKAISKRCDDRYDTARELAADLQRFLDGRPIAAKPPTPLERTVKWVKRYPAVAALVAVTVLGLIALSAGTMWHARTLSLALQKSEENHKEAVANEQKARERERSLQVHQYAWHMKVAADAWESRNGLLFRDVMWQAASDHNLTSYRGFEWNYLWNLFNPPCVTLRAHEKLVGCVAYSPDNQRLATASEDGTVNIWQIGSFKRLATLVGHTSCVNNVLYSHDGKLLATSSCDGTVKIWDARTFHEMDSFNHDTPVFGLAISPDGRTIAAGLGTGDQQTPGRYDVVVWDVSTGRRIHVLTGHQGDVRSVTFAPDGARLATASMDATVRVWNVASGELTHRLSHRGTVYWVGFFGNGQGLLSASYDGTAIVWDQNSWTPRLSVSVGADIYSAAVSADDAMLATGTGDGLIELWDSSTGTRKCAWMADNEKLSANDQRLNSDGRVNRVMSLAFSPDGSYIASGSAACVAKIWDLQQVTRNLSQQTLDRSCQHLVFNDALTEAVSIDRENVLSRWKLKRPANVVLHPTANCALETGSRVLAWTPSGGKLAASSPSGELNVIDAITGVHITTLSDPRGKIVAAEFLEDDSNLLAVVNCGGESPAWSAGVWDIGTSQELYQLPVHESGIVSLATHPARSVFAVAVGPKIEIHNLHTGECLARLGADESKDVNTIAFSPDGSSLGSICDGDDVIRIWDWPHQVERHRLIGGYGAVLSCLAFAPDGRTFATGENGGMVRLWNTETGQEMVHLPVSGAIGRLQFSKDGERLACWIRDLSTGRDEIQIWSTD